jgi:hypothetical protein
MTGCSRFTLFDHSGNPLAEIETLSTRSWILNDIGRCQFRIPTNDSKCLEKYLEYGNFIHVEHIPSVDGDGNARGKLPDWTGVILPPRTWYTGEVEIVAFSAEMVLHRRTPPFKTFWCFAHYDLMEKMLDYGNSYAWGGIKVQRGTFEVDGYAGGFWSDVYQTIFEHMHNFGEVEVVGSRDTNGKLNLTANWYLAGHKGIYSNIPLQAENTEGSSGGVLLTEQGTILNEFWTDSNPGTIGDRTIASARNPDSVSRYGLMQGKSIVQGANDIDLQNEARKQINLNSYPVWTFQPNALDVEKLFTYMVPGNTMPVAIPNAGFYLGKVGFQGTARLTGVEYSEASNTCRLVLEALRV